MNGCVQTIIIYNEFYPDFPVKPSGNNFIGVFKSARKGLPIS